ncbi:c6 zinc finger domain containing protein [Grosmannia clavigera kw1407]|uniref:C6 zinc finger domain containing protein n=1 Tax=Grosmannia clavigera (strain kw1407 / UAMH 11150) TaxID=655863 RepID=F0XDH9_GROCL|nr:c6 zinc finger domain containing protein [Grosmannia clavigera kw1407]EFX04193.1 c6 zinc finger domain containing protein [Grosmannia clavigera kw1407]
MHQGGLAAWDENNKAYSHVYEHVPPWFEDIPGIPCLFMDGSPLLAAGGGASLSPTSPVSVRSVININGVKRKRSTGAPASAGFDSSPGSVLNDDDNGDPSEKKRQPGVKRACNECRQQKLRCDVSQDPFRSCSRCNRLKLQCKIESNFKRIGKRSKHAEMEKEIEKLRRSVQLARSQGFVIDDDDDGPSTSQLQSPIINSVYTHTRNPSLMGSDEAVSSLLHLKRGGSYSVPRIVRELEEVRLTEEGEAQLFQDFWLFYHPFLPFLNTALAPEVYYQQHPLLYWSIVAVAARRYVPDPTLLTAISVPLNTLLWKTIGEVPGSHFVVKAMCLLCTWPLPTSNTSSDPTHILCGVMMKTATGIGLHRPNHINDFTRVAIELNKDQLHDRVVTWAVCNIVAQNVATGYGQPASSLYDWTLATRSGESGPFQLSAELEARLQIERFCDKVSKEMYSNASDSRGVAGDEHRSMLMRVFRREYSELHADIMSRGLSHIVSFHLKAAGLHLRLAGFFDASSTPGYLDDLMGLWRSTVSFLEDIISNSTVSSPSSPQEHIGIDTLKYASNYLQQMLVAAGFALLKLMRSFFSRAIDYDRGRRLFHRIIGAIRSTSVVHNDLQWRLAELMVQMWNGARLETQPARAYLDDDSAVEIDDTLQLKVRCRHSMSLVFDSIWHWREEYQARGRGTLDVAALKQPTNPDSANESTASSTHMDAGIMASNHGLPSLPTSVSNGALAAGITAGLAGHGHNGMLGGGVSYDANPTSYDFFDPQHWMLDNLLDFNYSYVPPMEGA